MSDFIASTIKQSPLFKHLSEQQLNTLIEAASVKEYGDGDRIIEEGQPARSLYMVVEGGVRVWTRSLDREVELKRLEDGAYFGEVSLMSGKSATANVDAVQTPTKLLAIERAAVLRVVEEDESLRKMLEGVTLARAKDTIGKVLQ